MEYLESETGTFIGELSSMVERELPRYKPGSLYQVDPYSSFRKISFYRSL